MVWVCDKNLVVNPGNEKAEFIGVGKAVDGEVGGEFLSKRNGVVNFFGGFLDRVDTAGVIFNFDSDSAV